MRKNDVVIGGEYQVQVGGRLAIVTVIAQRERRPWGNSRRQTVFECRTQVTGRTIIATPARLRAMPDCDCLVIEAAPEPLDICESLAAWSMVPVGAY